MLARLADGAWTAAGLLVPAMRRAALAAHGYGPELADLWRIEPRDYSRLIAAWLAGEQEDPGPAA